MDIISPELFGDHVVEAAHVNAIVQDNFPSSDLNNLDRLGS